jgi:hypothetical protein
MPTSTKSAALAPNSNPVSCPEVGHLGNAEHRNLYCFHYSDCLQFAARKGWRDWTCRECVLNLGAKPPGATQWAEARVRRD